MQVALAASEGARTGEASVELRRMRYHSSDAMVGGGELGSRSYRAVEQFNPAESTCLARALRYVKFISEMRCSNIPRPSLHLT